MAAAGRSGVLAGCAFHDSIVAFRLCKIKVPGWLPYGCCRMLYGKKKAVDSSSGINGVFVVQHLGLYCGVKKKSTGLAKKV